MPRAAQRVELPDGTPVWATNAVEAAVLYHELGEESVYSRHGIEVADGNCIFDVGANIGLYSVLLARAYRHLRIFAFEPVAPVYTLLERNIALHRGDASVELFECALGREAGTAEGELDPGLTFAATLRPRDVARAARSDVSALEFATALLPDLARSGQVPTRWADTLQRGLRSPVARWPSAAAVLLLAAGVRLRTGGLRKQRFACQVRSLSEVIRAYDVPTIDVLKVDVEGSEWEVLAGMAPDLWPRVRQVVVEVHDVDGRVGQIEGMLRAYGFQTCVDQEDWAIHPILGIYTVYARRPA